MRVAIVVPNLAQSSGGPAESVPRLASALAELGLSVELHWEESRSSEEPSIAPRQPVISFAAKPAWPYRLGRSPEMSHNLLDSAADIVHAQGVWMLPLRYAASSARRRGVPLVISPRGMLAPWSLRRSRLKKAVARLIVHRGAFDQAAGWHATSKQEADDIRALGFGSPICTAPNGVDTSPGDAGDSGADVRLYLQHAPQLEGRRVLLFYSRFHPTKRILELVYEFSLLAAAHPAWHLLAVGIPEQYSVERIRTEVSRYGMADRVTVLDGRALPKPYALADLFVLPSHVESFGRVVAEALAAGVPVITTDGTPWHALSAVGAGACVPLDGLGEALGEAMSRDERDLRLAGERGRRWISDRFSWRQCAGALAAFYEQLLRAPRP